MKVDLKKIYDESRYLPCILIVNGIEYRGNYARIIYDSDLIPKFVIFIASARGKNNIDIPYCAEFPNPVDVILKAENNIVPCTNVVIESINDEKFLCLVGEN